MTLLELIQNVSLRKGVDNQTAFNLIIKDPKVKFTVCVGPSSSGHNYGVAGTGLNIAKTKRLNLAAGKDATVRTYISGSITSDTRKQYGNAIYVSEIEVTGFAVTESDLKDDIKVLQARKKEIDEQIKDAKLKIAFIKDNGLETYDENEFKAYKVLQTLKAEGSDIEKAKIIAKLVSA